MEIMSLVAFASLTGIAAFAVRARAAAPITVAVRPVMGGTCASQGTGLSTTSLTTDSPRNGAGTPSATTDVALPAGRYLG